MAQEQHDLRTSLIERLRKLIEPTVPDVVEEVKWRKPSNGVRGVPVWSHNGILCTGETYKEYLKLTFAKGASLPDPKGLFNASLDGNARRVIDLRQSEKLNETEFQALARAAAELNTSSKALPRAKRCGKK